MFIYLYGPDTYRSSQTLSDMKAKFSRDRDPQGLNLIDMRVDGSTDGEIIEQLHAAPFLAEKRMIVLRSIIADGSKELHALLLDHIENDTLPKDIIVLATDGEVKPRAKASKALHAILQSQSYSKRFESMTARTLERWIADEVRTRGGDVDPAATRALSAQPDTWRLSHTIDQLVAYATGRTITEEDVAEFLHASIDANIFGLVDAAIAGKHKVVFKLLRDQYASGKDPHYIFAMLLRQYRIMLDIADALDRGLVPDPKAMGLHPFVLKKTIPLVRKSSLAHMRARYQDLLDIDTKIKTGSGDPGIMIDTFVGAPIS